MPRHSFTSAAWAARVAVSSPHSPRLPERRTSADEVYLSLIDGAIPVGPPGSRTTGRCHEFLHPLLDVEGNAFNTIIGIVIMLNAVVLGIETDSGKDRFMPMEHAFCIFFIGEMCIRLWQLGWGYFNDATSVFDLGLVVAGSLDLYLLPMLVNDSGGAWASPLRLLRLTRILRVVRLFKMFRDLSIIMTAFMNALSIVMWVSLILLIFIYMCSILLTQLIGHQSEKWGEDQEAVQEWFGTVPSSMRTLFIVTTLAEWDTIAFTLMEQLPPLAVFGFFIIFIMVASYTMTSLITGVICDSLTTTQRDDVNLKEAEITMARERLLRGLKRMFIRVDKDENGRLSKAEMTLALESVPDLATKLEVFGITITLDALVHLVDKLSDAKGEVDIDEYIQVLAELSGSASASSVLVVEHLQRMSLQETHSLNHKLESLQRQVDNMHAKLDLLILEVVPDKFPGEAKKAKWQL